MKVILLGVIWFCSARNVVTGETFSATSPVEARARHGAMNRCCFFSGDSSTDCLLDRCYLE